MAFADKSFTLGWIAGIPVRLHVTFPVVFVFALLAQSSLSWWGLGWVAITYGPLLLSTVLIHELGHSIAARQLGSSTHGILLWPLGGLAFVGHSTGPKADLLIALAGPLTHIPQFIVWFCILVPASLSAYGTVQLPWNIPPPDYHFGLAIIVGACWLNVILMVFNLCLPAYPLDGGRILADVLLLCGLEEVLAAKVTAGAAVALGLAVVAFGAWQVSVMTMLVGLWMLYTTAGLVQTIRAGGVQQHPMFCYEEPAASEEFLPFASKAGCQPYGGTA